MVNQIKTEEIADAVMHFSAYVITGDSSSKHFVNPVVVNYAMGYVLRVIKQNPQDEQIYASYKDVFWHIAHTFKKD